MRSLVDRRISEGSNFNASWRGGKYRIATSLAHASCWNGSVPRIGDFRARNEHNHCRKAVDNCGPRLCAYGANSLDDFVLAVDADGPKVFHQILFPRVDGYANREANMSNTLKAPAQPPRDDPSTYAMTPSISTSRRNGRKAATIPSITLIPTFCRCNYVHSDIPNASFFFYHSWSPANACSGRVRRFLDPASGDREEGAESSIDEDIDAPLWGNRAVTTEGRWKGVKQSGTLGTRLPFRAPEKHRAMAGNRRPAIPLHAPARSNNRRRSYRALPGLVMAGECESTLACRMTSTGLESIKNETQGRLLRCSTKGARKRPACGRQKTLFKQSISPILMPRYHELGTIRNTDQTLSSHEAKAS
ncbi:hypothetical protein LXA43DRAFT_614281 [Ganoderma leucocontextum]|nr:hypothetical protein LXA43DRAFT_614281 [Ganoderma leucocontextum]